MEAPKKEKRIRNRKDKKKSELIEKEENVTEKITVNSSNVEPNAKEHVQQLQRLQEKDPEFYEFLKEHGQDLLEFDDDEDDEDNEIDDDVDGTETQEGSDADMNDEKPAKEKKPQDTQKVITMSMVDTWCKEIREDSKLSAVRSLMRAFRTACHYGDQQEDTDPSLKFSVMSSSVFNKVMLVVLGEMDGILRGLLKFPSSGGKKETVLNATLTREWKNYHSLLKSYLGNALHVLNQMTDTEMIAFTLRRPKYSAMFLAAFPSLLRKYVKVSLHFWGTGGGALPVVSFLFLRDLCIRIGSDCIDDCFKGIYKAYILNAQFMNASKLQHIEFLGNCVIELYGVDLSTAYQHAFVFIRQLAMILKEALTMKTKESFRKVYEWKFMNCLELWTGAICAYSSEADFRPLAYPLTQIISGVARLVPTAKYFPLRLRCARMLNRIAAATDTFIPTSLLLLDMLEMKELNRSPSGGVGKAVDLRTSLKVSKPTLKTRSFQEACVFSVIEEVAEHLVQWSYSVAFFELSFIPLVRLRCFYKSTKVERFRREVKQLIHQVEINAEFTNAKRSKVTFLPNDIEATSFLEVEKKAGSSPLSKYVAVLHQRAQTRTDSLVHSNVIVGEKSSKFGGRISDSDEEDNNGDIEKGATVFSSSWLPGKDSTAKKPVEKKKRKLKAKEDKVAHDEDIVEELVLSSDDDEEPKSDDESLSDTSLDKENKAKPSAPKRNNKKRKPSKDPSKKKKFHTFKPKKKQRT